MSRHFQTVDYEATLDTTVRLGDCLPPDHRARVVVALVAQLALTPLYARYGKRGGAPYAPEILLALLFYAYPTGVFSSRSSARSSRPPAKPPPSATWRAIALPTTPRSRVVSRPRRRLRRPTTATSTTAPIPTAVIMKNSRDAGVTQQYNAQAAVEQNTLLIVGASLSHHANDVLDVAPPLAAIARKRSEPPRRPRWMRAISARPTWTCWHDGGHRRLHRHRTRPAPCGRASVLRRRGRAACAIDRGSFRETMAYKLRTALGKAIYRRRKCTVEPVFGQIEGGDGLSSVLLARSGGGHGRMVSGVPGLQPAAFARVGAELRAYRADSAQVTSKTADLQACFAEIHNPDGREAQQIFGVLCVFPCLAAQNR